jgi:hypothetical protein
VGPCRIRTWIGGPARRAVEIEPYAFPFRLEALSFRHSIRRIGERNPLGAALAGGAQLAPKGNAGLSCGCRSHRGLAVGLFVRLPTKADWVEAIGT